MTDEMTAAPIFQVKYRQRYIDVANNQRNLGRLFRYDGKAVVTGPCGDQMEFYLRIRQQRITKATFVTSGCSPSIACGSILTTLIKGRTVAVARQITAQDIINALRNLPESHHHCAQLAVHTFQQALLQWPGYEACFPDESNRPEATNNPKQEE